MERDAAALALALRDPLKPKLCAACLLCFRAYFLADVRKTNLRILRASHHEFWSCIMRFLTVKRTDISRSAVNRRLDAAWRACQSTRGPPKYHAKLRAVFDNRAVFENYDNMLREVVETLLDFLIVIFYDQSKAVVVESQKFSRHGLWPTSADDILPFGPESSYSTLLYWFTVLDCSHATTSFMNIMLLCRPELMPYASTPQNRRLLLLAIAAHFDVAARDSTERRPVLRDGRDPQKRIIVLGHLLQALIIGSGTSVDGRIFFHDLPDAFFRSVERVLPIMDDETERTRLAGVMDSAYNLRGIPLFERPPEVVKAFRDLQQQLGGSYTWFYTLLLEIRCVRVCSAPDCRRPERDLDWKLQRCSSCSVMQYCSRDCQRRHWKAEAFCHKTVCAQLKALLPLLDKGEEEFVSAARALLSIEQLAVVYDNVSLGNGDRTLSTAERLIQTEAMLRVQERMAQMSVHDPTDTLHTLRALGFRP